MRFKVFTSQIQSLRAKRSNPANYIICYLVLNVILRDMQVGFLNTSRQFYPKNLLRILITSNPLPKERGIAVLFKFTPHPNPKPLTKQFTGLFCSAESPRGRNTTFLLEILRFAQYDGMRETLSPLIRRGNSPKFPKGIINI